MKKKKKASQKVFQDNAHNQGGCHPHNLRPGSYQLWLSDNPAPRAAKGKASDSSLHTVAYRRMNRRCGFCCTIPGVW